MARWVLLALALGRRAVLPFVPCEIPRNVPALPPQLWETVIPFSNVSWCDAAARAPRAALPAAAALGWSAARADVAGNAARNERGERSACCLWVPPAACVDLVGRRAGGLRGELLLTEPDYGGEADTLLQPCAPSLHTSAITGCNPVHPACNPMRPRPAASRDPPQAPRLSDGAGGEHDVGLRLWPCGSPPRRHRHQS